MTDRAYDLASAICEMFAVAQASPREGQEAVTLVLASTLADPDNGGGELDEAGVIADLKQYVERIANENKGAMH